MTDFVWPAVRVDGDMERSRVEWVHGNGAGAYASSTVAQMHTRRYHGLLVAALEPPRRRHVIISHVDATAHVAGTAYSLATHQFPGVPPTAGYRFISHFSLDPLPRWVFQLNGAELEQLLALARGENTLVLRYTWRGDRPISLELRPLLALRPFHELVHEHGAMLQRVEMRQHEVSVRPVPALPRLVFRHRGVFIGSPDWWRRFEYLAEQARGMDFQEDLWTPGVFRINLEPNVPAHLVCGLDNVPQPSAEQIIEQAAESLRACDPGPDRAWPVRSLSVAADLFRVDLAPVPGIIAGYPWFELWGRHTLMSLPGLYLVPGKLEQAKHVIATLVAHLRDGRLPNRLPDDGRPAEYHAVDASLLLFPVGRRLVDQLDANDPFFAETLWPALREVFHSFVRGTVDGIHVTAEGLLAAGGEGTSLTWMDARVHNRPVTSRAGVAVEIQALWSVACDHLASLAKRAGDQHVAQQAAEARDRARDAFRRRFWCEATDYPYDVISEASQGPEAWADPSIRPNAMMALAFDPQLFSQKQAEAIMGRVERELLTPAGIRSLSPHDTQYRGSYGGSVTERDKSYHQGTAWPFLMGAFARALKATYPNDQSRFSRLRAMLEGMLSNTLALGQVAEIADGDPPHRPNGCVAQAASVGELLRVFVEDLGL